MASERRRMGEFGPRITAYAVSGALALAVLLGMGTAPSYASWKRVLAHRSKSHPYFACAAHRKTHCHLIVDPTRGTRRNGPVSAGAITAGPELETSPALKGHGVEGGFSPEDLRKAYKLPSTSAGTNQTVAVVDAFDDPNAEADLNAYRSHYGIPTCTSAGGSSACFRKVNQYGETSHPATSVEWAEEISLDLDMVSAICPAATSCSSRRTAHPRKTSRKRRSRPSRSARPRSATATGRRWVKKNRSPRPTTIRASPPRSPPATKAMAWKNRPTTPA